MQNILTTNIVQRVFCLFYGNSYGTCFTLDFEGRQYIATAKHVVQNIKDEDTVLILQESQRKTMPVKLVGHTAGPADISVLATNLQLSPTHPVSLSSEGAFMSGDVYFLGFPYRYSSEGGEWNNNFPIPFVKKGILSAVNAKTGELYLDGHNNPGFSGGPVVYMDGKKPVVIAVVSAYKAEPKAIYGEGMKTGLFSDENTGIVIAHKIEHALDLIKNNPAGFLLTGDGS